MHGGRSSRERTARAMEYEDRRTIATPEGVQLALPLAGIATRFMALMLDMIIGTAIGLIAVLAAGAIAGAMASAIVAASAILVFYIGYQVAVRGRGRRSHARQAGLRPARGDGQRRVGRPARQPDPQPHAADRGPPALLPARDDLRGRDPQQPAPRRPAGGHHRRPRAAKGPGGRRRAAAAEPPGRALRELGRHGRRRGRVHRRARVPGAARRTWTRGAGGARGATGRPPAPAGGGRAPRTCTTKPSSSTSRPRSREE